MKVVIPDSVNRKIMHWVNKSEYEVSGLGKVTTDDQGNLTVIDVMLLPQKNAAAHTDIEGEDVGRAMYLLRDTPGMLKFWWHSHVNMSVFWSTQDKETIKLCGTGGWCVATVFNKMNERKSAFYSVQGMDLPWGRHELFFEDIPTEVEKAVDPMAAAWDAEYDKNVKIQSSILGLGMDWAGRSTTNPLRGTGGTTTAPTDTTEGVVLVWRGVNGATSYLEGAGLAGMLKREKKALLKQLKKERVLSQDKAGISAIRQTQMELAAQQLGTTATELTKWQEDTAALASDDSPEDVTVDDELDLFDQTDKMVMLAAGLTEDDVNELADETYWSAAEIIDFVCAGWNVAEINWCSAYAESHQLDAEEMMTLYDPMVDRNPKEERVGPV